MEADRLPEGLNWTKGQRAHKTGDGVVHELARTNATGRRFYKIEAGHFWFAKQHSPVTG